MENLLIWQIVTGALGAWATYIGARLLRQSDKDYIADLERGARRRAKIDGISEDEAMRKFVDYIRKDPRGWRIMRGARGLALGLVLLFAFALLVLLDIGT
jgi:hypothetical protein